MEVRALTRKGLYMDDLTRKLRLLNPDYSQMTRDLIDECLDYLKGAKDFKTNSEIQVAILINIKKIAECQKYEVIGKRSHLLSLNWHKQVIWNKMLMELKEKRIKLERAKFQQQFLGEVKREQQETLQIICRR